jgi:NTE family protein
MLGLVLTAGGARGAYQAGVLKRLGELPGLRGGRSPFPIITGASAGAINGSIVAARSARFAASTRQLADIWSGLRFEQVVRTDWTALARTALGLAGDLALGALLGRTVTHSLFDASPLEALLREAFPPRGIADAIRRGDVYAVAVSATSYHSGRSFTFIEGRPGHPIWTKSRRVVLPVTLSHRHVLASAAIPIVFPPVRLLSSEGELWFGDGALRLVTPFSPAIRLGARHVLAVGVRSQRAAEALAQEERRGALERETTGTPLPRPPLAQVCGVFMNAIFLDHLDADLDHLHRMNQLVEAAARRGSSEAADDGAGEVAEPMRVVKPLVISPSQDLALVARDFAGRMPRFVRYALEGLGTPDAQSADLMSYLLFDSAYTGALVEIGYKDADERASEIEAFLHEAGALRAAAPRAPRRAPRAQRQAPA